MFIIQNLENTEKYKETVKQKQLSSHHPEPAFFKKHFNIFFLHMLS